MRRTDWFIAAVLLASLLVPLRYYLAEDGYGDTRFAWRMFSRSDTQRCGGAFQRPGADGRLPLPSEVGAVWRSQLDRGSLPVARQVGRLVCEQAGPPVELAVTCRDLTGSRWSHTETICHP